LDQDPQFRSRRGLVFGPPASGVEVVADQLSEELDEVDAWDGSEPWPSAELLELVDAGRWSLIVRTESREACSLRRLLAGGRVESLVGALDLLDTSRERQSGLRVRARMVLDSSRLTDEHLRTRLKSLLEAGLGQRPVPILVLESFAYPNGIPLDLDWCCDARALHNPYWETDLRPYSGLAPEVRQYVTQQPLSQLMVERMEGLVLEQMPSWSEQGRQAVRLGMGCTGGFHRSVALCEELGDRLSRRGLAVVRWHREVPDGPAR
jgi:UPF0042 nucleotide-binding protein